MDAIAAALGAASTLLEEGATSPGSASVIAASSELHERELIKMAALASALAGALRRGASRLGREPGRGGGDRRIQDRLRTLGR